MDAQAIEIARGHWGQILPGFGISSAFLVNRHGPCVICGGKDRWKYDDLQGRGTWLCNQCGAGDGFQLLKLKTGRSFKELADEVRTFLGATAFDGVPRVTPNYKTRMEKIWQETVPIISCQAATRYLTNRIGNPPWPLGSSVRAHTNLWHRYDKKCYPALVAKVASPDNRAVNLHLTFLGSDGKKADTAQPRLLMPGTISEGSAVRLGPASERMGIAEGIETALSAHVLHSLPVWAGLNGNLLAKWTPPEVCREVVIFADNDANYTGQAKAYAIANRLTIAGLSVTVMIPGIVGWDFNDALRAKMEAG